MRRGCVSAYHRGMKLIRVAIENFKGIKALEIGFLAEAGPAQPRSLTALLGDNGSGKTSVLQAIALTLSLATRRTRRADELRWHGFLAERVATLGRTSVTLTISLEQDEVELTSALYRQWYDSLSSDWRQTHRIIEPSQLRTLELVYESGDFPGRLTSPQGYAAINQLLGRYYVKVLRTLRPEIRQQFFARLGDVFWFDQHRNLGSAITEHTEETGYQAEQIEGWSAGVEQLREFLIGWWAYHTSPKQGGKDYLLALEQRFSELFPGTVFRGVVPRETGSPSAVQDFYFLLERDGTVYDLAEMSSGEQAIFPLFYEFVRLNITRSVVLIDELELHLHPPQQQALLQALRRIGPDSQFIITTH